MRTKSLEMKSSTFCYVGCVYCHGCDFLSRHNFLRFIHIFFHWFILMIWYFFLPVLCAKNLVKRDFFSKFLFFLNAFQNIVFVLCGHYQFETLSVFYQGHHPWSIGRHTKFLIYHQFGDRNIGAMHFWKYWYNLKNVLT